MIRKHSATLHGHRTSFTLEEPFWHELKHIADQRGIPLARLIAEIDARFGKRLPVSRLFEYPTIAGIASLLRQEGELPQLATTQNGPAAANFSEWLKQTIEKRNGK